MSENISFTLVPNLIKNSFTLSQFFITSTAMAMRAVTAKIIRPTGLVKNPIADPIPLIIMLPALLTIDKAPLAAFPPYLVTLSTALLPYFEILSMAFVP